MAPEGFYHVPAGGPEKRTHSGTPLSILNTRGMIYIWRNLRVCNSKNEGTSLWSRRKSLIVVVHIW